MDKKRNFIANDIIRIMEIDIIIDSLTNCLVDIKTGKEYNTEYRLIKQTITKNKAKKLQDEGWIFDWSKPHKDGCEIYELLIEGSDEVQGMIALKHYREDFYTYVDLVESAPHNLGINKKYDGVGAHLFAIACKLSFDAGNDGYLMFASKTKLVNHYIDKLGATCYGDRKMIIDTSAALKLVEKYFNNKETL